MRVQTLYILMVGLLVLLSAVSVRAAPGIKPDYVVYVWDEVIYAQSLQGGDVRNLGRVFPGFATQLPTDGYDIYSISGTPYLELLEPNWGFQHGVWSRDRRQMVYLEVEHLSPHYRVKLLLDDMARLLLEDEVNATRGYLDPLGWTADGDILLMERYSLHMLNELRVWRINPNSLETDVIYRSSTRPIKGRSAVNASGHGAFIGLAPDLQVGFSFDFDKLQVLQFAAPTDIATEPDSIFELYPINVFGVIPGDSLNHFASDLQTVIFADSAPVETAQPEAWLYWPVADEIRFITCLPDSRRTAELYIYTCPGLERDYPGHQGTDISYRPGGLPLGTDVYPAAPGVVIDTVTTCIDESPSCNGAYGNSIAMEHTLVVNGDTQTWYTGYGHLEFVLVEPNTFIANIGQSIALSGDSGVGGPHLHFEARYPHGGGSRWVDPWDTRNRPDERNLWVGSNDTPTSAASFASAAPVVTLCTVTSVQGNNIRRGPGVIFDKLAETSPDERYEVTAVVNNSVGEAPGDWYRVLFNNRASEGWVWAGLVSGCEN